MAVDKKAEARFLTEKLDIPPGKAAHLVIEDDQAADALGMEILAEQREQDKLEGLPVPSTDADPQHTETGVEDLHKPVVPKDSAPT